MAVKSNAKRFPSLLLNNRHYSGTFSTLLYNWPIFAGIAFFGLVCLIAGLFIVAAPWQWLLFVPAIGSFAVIGAILLATYLVYDAGPTREYDRLAQLGQVAEANVVLDITAGKLRGSRGLLTHFPQGHYFLLDIYDAKKMSDNALTRARQMEPPLNPGRRIYQRPAQVDKLPVPHQWADIIFCDFSLHELQDAADRQALFAEFARVLKPNGRLLIAEHSRDWRNFLAFGPGVLTFFTAATWQQHIAQAGLSIRHHECWRGLVNLWVVGK